MWWNITLGGRKPQIAACTTRTGDNQWSIGGYIVKIGRIAVIWKSKGQSCVALSLTEAEYIALCQAAKESVWMVNFLSDLGISIFDTMMMGVNNEGSMAFAKNRVFYNRSKHLGIQPAT